MRRAREVLLLLAPAVGVLSFLALWQLLVWAFDVRQFVLPAPWDVLDEIRSDPGFYVRNGRRTLWEASLGFGLGAVAGVLAAMAMAHSRFVERAAMPIVVLLQVTPIIAYAPATVLWVGWGLKAILVITAAVCFVPFAINGVTGLRSVDPNLLELARSVDASRVEVLVRLRLPSALPHLFAAARIAVGLALIGAVLGEFFAYTDRGLGVALKVAQGAGGRGALQLWGCIFVLALLGGVSTILVSYAERGVLRWHSSQRT